MKDLLETDVRELRLILTRWEVMPDENGFYDFKVSPDVIAALGRIPYANRIGVGEVIVYGIHFWSWQRNLSHMPADIAASAQ